MKRVLFLILWLSLFFFALPARAQTALPQPVARAVIFTNHLCRFCREIIEKELPPVTEPFGEQLEILFIDITTPEGRALYQAAWAAFDSPPGVGLPRLFFGQTVVLDTRIPTELPALVEAALAQGGQDWPAIPGLEAYLASDLAVSSSPSAPAPTSEAPVPQSTTEHEAVVHALMYSMEGCPHCEEVTRDVLPPLYAQYGERFDLQIVEVVTLEDVDHLYQVAAEYGISKEETGVPLLIIGQTALVGADEIRSRLPTLIEKHLSQGGLELPAAAIAARPASTGEARPLSSVKNNGFTLAILMLILMAAALVYSLIALARGVAYSLPPWSDYLIPLIILAGIGVAGYLSYVETQKVIAVCGPVGDCNAVQNSPYATLFGVLPVGVLGLLGYLGLLAAWLAQKYISSLKKLATLAFLGLSLFAVAFSLYLTFLEPFVIKAVCAWCLASALLVTLLLLLSLPSAARLRRGKWFELRN